MQFVPCRHVDVQSCSTFAGMSLTVHPKIEGESAGCAASLCLGVRNVPPLCAWDVSGLSMAFGVMEKPLASSQQQRDEQGHWPRLGQCQKALFNWAKGNVGELVLIETPHQPQQFIKVIVKAKVTV